MFSEATRQADDDDENGHCYERVDQDKTKLAECESEVKQAMHTDQPNREICAEEGPDATVLPMTRGGGVPLVDIAREYIRLQIQRLGLTEKDFGIKCGIHASSLNDMLKGKRRVHFDHLQKVIAALNIEASSMMKVMMEIAKEMEAGHPGYAPLPGRARGYVIVDQKEAVRHALRGLRKSHRREEEEDD